MERQAKLGEYKVCRACEINKHISEFTIRSTRNTIESKCKPCRSIIQRKKYERWKNDPSWIKRRQENNKEWHRLNPDKRRNISLKNRYGISLSDYQNLLEHQNHTCAICKQAETIKYKNKILPLAVDHNHITNEVRGLLCNRCNTTLGKCEENVDLLINMTNYIKKHSYEETGEIKRLVG